jgi:hypothetical protein
VGVPLACAERIGRYVCKERVLARGTSPDERGGFPRKDLGVSLPFGVEPGGAIAPNVAVAVARGAGVPI